MLKAVYAMLLLIAAVPQDDQKALDAIKKRVNNLTNEDFYENLEFKNKQSGEVKKLSDFPEFEKQLFYMWMAEHLTREMKDKQKDWDSKGDDWKPLVTDIKALREKHVKHWEKLANEVFDKYKNKFSSEEIELYKKKMKEINKD